MISQRPIVAVVEGWLAFVAAIGAVWLWRSGMIFSPDDATWLIPLTWIVAAVAATWPLFPGSRDLFTRAQWLGSPRATTAALLWGIAVVLPLFGALYLFYHGWWRGAPIDIGLPADWGRMVYYQFVFVSFPEELFFRGYLQQRLDDAFGRPYRLLGASWGPGLLMANLLFAAGHVLVTNDVSRADVFFPGLLFGWLQARTGALVAPILFHGACNVALFTLQAWVASVL
jgi:membrane protease YdiL (CAAX protease family)